MPTGSISDRVAATVAALRGWLGGPGSDGGVAAVVVAGVVVASVAVVPLGPVGGLLGGPEQTTATDPDFELRIDATVHENGLVNVTLTTNETVDNIQVTKSALGADPTVTSDAGALVEKDTKLVWDPSVDTTVSYSVPVGQLSYGSAVLNESVLFRTSGFAPVYYWRGGDLVRWEFSFDAPSGWNVAAPGKQVGPTTYVTYPSRNPEGTYPREVFAVGNFSVTSATTNTGATVRTVKLPSADAGPDVSTVSQLNADAIPEVETIYNATTEYPRLAIVVPAAIEEGGAARHHSYVVADDRPLYRVQTGQSVYLEELVHTYQSVRGPGWYTEGSASYLKHYVLWRTGRVNESQFRRMVQADVTTDFDGVGYPVNRSAGESKYKKGEAIFAALDMDLRARTDGEVTLGDFLQYQARNGGLTINESEFVEGLEAVSGARYDLFYYNFVERPLFPGEILQSNFSISAPLVVDHGPPPRSVLVERLGQANETIDRLENETATINVTVDSDNASGNFYPGDTLVATAESRHGDRSALAVTYRGRTRRVGADGQVAFELTGWGRQDLTLRYGDVATTATVTVGGTDALHRLWSLEVPGRLQYSTVAAGRDLLFVGGLGRNLTAVHRNGSVAWTFRRSGALSDSSPAHAAGRVFVGSGGGVVYALNASTGGVAWQTATDSAVVSSPVVSGVAGGATPFDDATAYVGSNDGTVLALSAADGSRRWTTDLGGAVLSGPAVDAGNDTVFVTTDAGEVVALNATTGRVRWRYATGVELGHAAPVVVGGDVLVAADRLYRLDGDTGTVDWATDYGGAAGSTPTVVDGTVYLGGADGAVYALDATDGSVTWQASAGDAVVASPAVVDGRVVAATLGGDVVAFDAATGQELTRVPLGGPIRSAPTVVDDTVFLGDRTGTLVALGNVDGNVSAAAVA